MIKCRLCERLRIIRLPGPYHSVGCTCDIGSCRNFNYFEPIIFSRIYRVIKKPKADTPLNAVELCNKLLNKRDV
jgi:hypothetical protein